MSRELDKLSINAIRVLSADAIEKSQSGHPGLTTWSSNYGIYFMGKDEP